MSALKQHMAVHDDDPGYIARFKSAALDDFQQRVTGVDSVELLRIAAALDPRYKTLRCLSPEEKDLTWTVIEEKVSNAATNNAQFALLLKSYWSAIMILNLTRFVNRGTNASD